MSSILQHPSLGTFHGRSEAGVVQFLGIQYATLEDRLAEPQLKTEYGGQIDATKVGYRVGVPGFLTSQELRDAGYKANNGLRDQRTALLWVKQFIDGFGGNPDRVTLAGQSAGAGMPSSDFPNLLPY
ncbi:hypothetical protein SEUCBS139899_006126 [Sporothrix eucalyptigena]